MEKNVPIRDVYTGFIICNYVTIISYRVPFRLFDTQFIQYT